MLHFIGTIEIHTEMTDIDNGQFSVLVLFELSAGFDTAGGFFLTLVHSASRYYFVVVALLLFFYSPSHWSLLPGNL